MVNVLLTIVPLLFKIVGFILIFALGIAWVAIVISLLFSSSYIYTYLPIIEWQAMLGVFNIFVLIGVPILFIVLLILRMVYGTRLAKKWKIGLNVLWFLSLISFGLIAAKGIESHIATAEITAKTPIPVFPFDTIAIDFQESNDSYYIQIDDIVQLNNQKLSIDAIDISIEESEDEKFRWSTSLFANGATTEEAADFAEQIDFNLQLEGNHLIIPKYLYLQKGEKWHNQRVHVTIWIPVGKHIVLSRDLLHHSHYIQYRGDSSPWRHRNKIWKMEERGLVPMD